MAGKKRQIRLSIAEIGACLENVELWVRFVKDALENYNEATDTSVLYATGGVITPQPPRLVGCPPPEEGSWSDTPGKGRKPKKDDEKEDKKDDKKDKKKKKKKDK